MLVYHQHVLVTQRMPLIQVVQSPSLESPLRLFTKRKAGCLGETLLQLCTVLLARRTRRSGAWHQANESINLSWDQMGCQKQEPGWLLVPSDRKVSFCISARLLVQSKHRDNPKEDSLEFEGLPQ